jgi:hypothetical protein
VSERRTFRWPKAARDIVKAHLQASGRERTELITRLSEITGNPRDACFRFAYSLGLRNKRAQRAWAEPESQALLDLALQGYSAKAIASKLGRSRGSIGRQLRREGITLKVYRDTYSKHQLARLLHIRPRAVQKWVDDGLLAARREPTGKTSRLIILAEDFHGFAETHYDRLVKGYVKDGRLDFLLEVVFPRCHSDLFQTRSAKKEEAAYQEQMLAEAEEDDVDSFGTAA